MTIWQKIPNLSEYEASDRGDIRRVRASRPPLILVPSLKEDGYWRVSVWIDGKRCWKPVNRLVCAAFHGEAPSNASMACHSDGCKDHNHPGNLYWGTAKSNYEDAVRHGTAHLKPIQIDDEALKEWFNRDFVLNRQALSAYEWGKFGGVRTSKQRSIMRKEAASRGYTTNAQR